MPEPAFQLEPMISAGEIAGRVDGLADAIAEAFGEEVVMVPILKGAVVFAADLMRALGRRGVSVRLEFLRLASYGAGTESSGRVQLLGPVPEVAGARVLVVEDILDSGRSATFAKELLRNAGAAEVSLCALLDKPSRRVVPLAGDFVGFTIPDRFVVGYGVDWNERFRERPDVAAVVFG